MRAVIIEIYKHHCIAVTPDGRFVKRSIEQGEHEIGDEILIEARHLIPEREWTRAIAIAAAAVIVIGLGSWGIIGAFGRRAPAEAGMIADAMVMEEQKATGEEIAEEVEEEAIVESAESEDNSYGLHVDEIKNLPAGAGEIDVDFDLEIANTGTPIKTIAGNLLFTYWMADSEEGSEMLFTIEILDGELSFAGIIDAGIYDGDETLIGENSFEFEGFAAGERHQEFIRFDGAATTLNIKISGIFE